MISESFIGEDVWSEAPDDPEEAFLFLVLAARAKLDAILSGQISIGRFSEVQWRTQYITELHSIAEELDVGPFSALGIYIGSNEKFDNFDIDLARIVTRLRARKRSVLKYDSVQLSIVTKSEIRKRIEFLRDFVNRSNLSEDAKSRLRGKIDAVEAELDNKRSSLSSFWVLAGAFSMSFPVAVSTLADLPQALETVSSIVDAVNQAKSDERADQVLLLEAPPLRLEYDRTPPSDESVA
jgi:hypothetical protein